MKKKCYDYLWLLKNANQAISQFVPKISLRNRLHLFLEVQDAYLKNGYDPKDFFLFDYHSLTAEERLSYICKREHYRMVYFFNSKSEIEFLQDKWKTYQRYFDFFNRKVFNVTWDSKTEWRESLSSFEKLIIKPIDGTFGNGVRIMGQQDFFNISALKKLYPKGFVAEEIIEQDDEMSALHPESVNTIRIYTICYGMKVVAFHPWLRIGRGSSIIDNASAGGIGAACDFRTGKITRAGDKLGHVFEVHPDNGKKLIGFKIPQWEDAIDLAKRLALVNPQLHYAGWDLALSKNGWVLVEGNPRAQMGFQIFENKGFRPDLDSILKDFNLFDDYYSVVFDY